VTIILHTECRSVLGILDDLELQLRPNDRTVAIPVAAPPTPAAPAPAIAVSDTPSRREPAIILSPYLPENNDGIWFRFANQRWVNAGRAEPQTDAFNQVGTYSGFPVYRRDRGNMDLIYLPSGKGLLTPYRRKS